VISNEMGSARSPPFCQIARSSFERIRKRTDGIWRYQSAGYRGRPEPSRHPHGSRERQVVRCAGGARAGAATLMHQGVGGPRKRTVWRGK
jgi:hypothetical protein